MISRVVPANAAGEIVIPTPCFALLVVQLTGVATAFVGSEFEGQQVLASAIVMGRVYPIRAQGKAKLTGATAGGTYAVAVAQSEWEATVLR